MQIILLVRLKICCIYRGQLVKPASVLFNHLITYSEHFMVKFQRLPKDCYCLCPVYIRGIDVKKFACKNATTNHSCVTDVTVTLVFFFFFFLMCRVTQAVGARIVAFTSGKCLMWCTSSCVVPLKGLYHSIPRDLHEMFLVLVLNSKFTKKATV